MNFEEYRKAFWAGVAGATVAAMTVLANGNFEIKAIAAAAVTGGAAGFLAAFLPANTINGENVMEAARGKL